jgi:hypothetical protein
MSDQKVDSITASSTESEPPSDNLHYARRGSLADNRVASDNIKGYDADRMRGRTWLSVEEEKRLIRKIDLRLMTLCSIMFLLKNIDADNVSNARIMNRGQPSNIMTELGMTSNEYNLVTTMYYVSNMQMQCYHLTKLTVQIPYIIAEAPSNLVLKRLLPSRWQSRIMITWG